MNVHWCYSTPRLCCNYCCQISDFPHARPESFISDCVEFMLRLLMCTVSCVWSHPHLPRPGVLAQLSEGEVKGGETGQGWRWNIQELVQEVCLLRRRPRKQHPFFQAVSKPANSVMYGGDCRDCRQHHEPTLGLQQVLFSWPPLWPCDYKFIEKYNLVIMNLLRNTTGIWLQSTSARSWCWNSI